MSSTASAGDELSWKSGKWRWALLGAGALTGALVAYYYWNKSPAGAPMSAKSKPVPTKASDDLSEQIVESDPLKRGMKLKDRGNKLFQRGRFADAIACYDQAIECLPPENAADVAACYQNKAAVSEKLKSFDQVIANCSQALQLQPRYAKALSRRCMAYKTLNQLNDALNDAVGVCWLEDFEQMSSVRLCQELIKAIVETDLMNAIRARTPDVPSPQSLLQFVELLADDPIWRPLNEHAADNYANGDAVVTDDGETTELHLPDEQPNAPEADAPEADASSQQPSSDSAYGTAHVLIRGVIVDAGHRAADWFERALALCSEEIDNAGAHVALALSLRATLRSLRLDYTGALADLQTLVDDPRPSAALKAHALSKKALLHLNNFEEQLADTCLNEAERYDPNSFDLLFTKAQTAMGLMNFELYQSVKQKVDRLLKKSKRRFPAFEIQTKFTEFQINRSMGMGSEQNETLFMENFQQLLNDFPDSQAAITCKVQLMMSLGRQQEMLSEIDERLAKQPSNALLLIQKVLCAAPSGETVPAEERHLMLDALQHDPAYDLAHSLLAGVLMAEGSFKEAVEHLQLAFHYSRNMVNISQAYVRLRLCQAMVVASDVYGPPRKDPSILITSTGFDMQ